MYFSCFRFVCYRVLDELKSRTLVDKCCGCNFCGNICDNGFSEIEDAKFWWGVSARHRKSTLRMHNFDEKYPQVIENVGCRWKICEGSILKPQKRQDVDAIVHDRQAEKYLQVQRKASCRYIGLKKSICNNEYQDIADTTVATKASTTLNKRDV